MHTILAPKTCTHLSTHTHTHTHTLSLEFTSQRGEVTSSRGDDQGSVVQRHRKFAIQCKSHASHSQLILAVVQRGSNIYGGRATKSPENCNRARPAANSMQWTVVTQNVLYCKTVLMNSDGVDATNSSELNDILLS